MVRNLGIAVALSVVVGCAAGSKSAEQSPATGSTHKSEAMRDTEAREPTVEATASAPAPPADDYTPKGGGETAAAPPKEKKTVDAKELGKSSAALGNTDNPDLFANLAVKVESAKLGTKASTDLSTAVASKTSELDACFVAARQSNSKLAGTIELAFTVDADGAVSGVAVKKSTVKNKVLETCVKDVAKLVKLDKSLVAGKTKASVVLAFGS